MSLRMIAYGKSCAAACRRGNGFGRFHNHDTAPVTSFLFVTRKKQLNEISIQIAVSKVTGYGITPYDEETKFNQTGKSAAEMCSACGVEREEDDGWDGVDREPRCSSFPKPLLTLLYSVFVLATLKKVELHD
ncbi:hypothetical protein AOLI_G00164810 [Acnodon oligacanthus]